MTDDIREQAARAAEKHVRGDGRPLTWTEMTEYIAGYLAGYEAAKAEAVMNDPRLVEVVEEVTKCLNRLNRVARGLP